MSRQTDDIGKNSPKNFMEHTRGVCSARSRVCTKDKHVVPGVTAVVVKQEAFSPPLVRQVFPMTRFMVEAGFFHLNCNVECIPCSTKKKLCFFSNIIGLL